jgi:hypothetical protein
VSIRASDSRSTSETIQRYLPKDMDKGELKHRHEVDTRLSVVRAENKLNVLVALGTV